MNTFPLEMKQIKNFNVVKIEDQIIMVRGNLLFSYMQCNKKSDIIVKRKYWIDEYVFSIILQLNFFFLTQKFSKFKKSILTYYCLLRKSYIILINPVLNLTQCNFVILKLHSSFDHYNGLRFFRILILLQFLHSLTTIWM